MNLTPVMAWFFSTAKQNYHWYNQSRVLNFKKRISSYTVGNAWDKVVGADPALRTRFVERQGEMRMEVLPFKPRF